MAPSTPVGRPCCKWTSSRRRKLARLYVLTTLNDEEIAKVLETKDFNPGRRDIQKKRRSLFSADYTKQWRAYRPRDFDSMKARTSTITRSRQYRVSKSKRGDAFHHGSRTSVHRPVSLVNRPYCESDNAFRDYSDQQTLTNFQALQDSQPTSSWQLMWDGSSVSSSSDQSSITRSEFGILLRETGRVCQELRNSELKVTQGGSNITRDASTPIPGQGIRLSDLEKTVTGMIPESDHSQTAASTLQTPHNTDRDTKTRSRSSLGTIANRLPPTRSSSYVQHVCSVLRLSSTDSYRSSVSHGSNVSFRSSWMSFCSVVSKSSGGPHANRISQPVLTNQLLSSTALAADRETLASLESSIRKGKRDLWDDLVDESQLIPAPDQRPRYCEISLTHRPCCSLRDSIDRPCLICGFSPVHAWARRITNWALYPLGVCPEEINKRDFFGNTPLHFAAASCNATAGFILTMIESGADVLAKNSSNQSFLHVLKISEITFGMASEDLGGYSALLSKVKELGLNFLDRDCHGRTVGHMISPDLYVSLLNLELLDESVSSFLDNHGYSPKSRICPITGDVKKQWPPHTSTFRHTVSSIEENLGWSSSVMVDFETKLNYTSDIDVCGNTPLLALVKKWRDVDGSEQALKEKVVLLIEMGAFVDMRDRKGYTALAIAAIRGSRPCVQALLAASAAPNTRNYTGKGILVQALNRMHAARRENRDEAYAKILSCVNLLVDSPQVAKLEPTERDEWILSSAPALCMTGDGQANLTILDRFKKSLPRLRG